VTRRFRANARGLSEIVGSLMLVLIVVSAATAFSLFIASYQKQLQAEQAQTHDRALEAVQVITVATLLNRTLTDGTLLNVNFTLASLDVNPMVITGIDIDNQAVRNYSANELNLTTGVFETDAIAAGGVAYVGSHEDITVIIDASPGAGSSFYEVAFGLHASDYVQIDIFTALHNDFRSQFLPPTAIAIVSVLETWDATTSTFVPVPLLNGLNSLQPGNASIVHWSWTVQPDNTTAVGGEVEPVLVTTGIVHTVTLTVTNNYGLIGTDTIQFSD
jgi:flagellin-like protein